MTYAMQNPAVLLKILPSYPVIAVAEVATAMLCGEIILPAVAPAVLAAASQYGLAWMELATSLWSAPNNTFEDVSLPVTKVPSVPIAGEIIGKKEPVDLTRTLAISVIIPL